MNEFYVMLEHLKSLYENGLYEDVKLLSDLLLGLNETTDSQTQSFLNNFSSSSSFSTSATSSTSSIANGLNSATTSSTVMGSSSTSTFQCGDSKDKYTILYYYGNSAFNLREYKLAESLFGKALQINKSNLRPKTKTLTSLVNIQ
jgi:hypothetical protein